MIDIEKAKELVQNKVCEKLCPDECHKPCEAYGIFVDLVLAGLAEGRKEGCKERAEEIDRVEWHDLRENPNDLPKYENSMTIRICWINPYGNKCYHDAYYDGKWFYWISDKTCKKQYADCGVIAWCELPQFEKKRKCLAKKQKPSGKKMTRVIMDWNRRNDKSL